MNQIFVAVVVSIASCEAAHLLYSMLKLYCMVLVSAARQQVVSIPFRKHGIKVDQRFVVVVVVVN